MKTLKEFINEGVIKTWLRRNSPNRIGKDADRATKIALARKSPTSVRRALNLKAAAEAGKMGADRESRISRYTSIANAIQEAVKRDPERAAKLSDYLAKRHGEHEYRFKSVNQNPEERDEFDSARHHHKYELTKYSTEKRFKARSSQEWYDANKKKFKREHVPVKDLTLTQGKVWNQGVKEKLKGEGPGEIGPIRVIHYNDKHYVVDGHHRVAAAKLKGDEEIEAHVMKIPKTPQQKKKEKRGF